MVGVDAGGVVFDCGDGFVNDGFDDAETEREDGSGNVAASSVFVSDNRVGQCAPGKFGDDKVNDEIRQPTSEDILVAIHRPPSQM